MILAPWIVLGVPSQVFLGFGPTIALATGLLGLFGMFAKKQVLAAFASVILLVLLVAGKVGTDLTRSPSPDTALLLLQFAMVIFFMEASRVVLSFEMEASSLVLKMDEMSNAILERLFLWVKGQLSWQFRMVFGALGISLVLLTLGGLASFSFNQIAFSAVLVLLVVSALLFLATQRREPETARALK